MSTLVLIPLLPAAGAALNGLVGIRVFPKRTAGIVASLAMLGSFGLSLLAFVQLVALPVDARVREVVVASWLPSTISLGNGGVRAALSVDWALRLDPLSALMILVVTGIGTLIHVYATAYMHDEPRAGVARFFAYLNLFCFFMLTLVLGSNALVMFVGWEGVGLCSYLLIGYWYEKPTAANAGRKAFLTNRVGDWGFILGICLLFTTFGTLDFAAVQRAAAAMPIESTRVGVLSAIALLFFIGATGKSAQIPLYVWLPDAMEGPTPVSALIHAATMVTAGVYMLCRNAVLFSHAPQVLHVVAVVGVLTALMAATIALVQYDIKRVLAYSTVSQLGYMFTAVGVGAFSAGAFHLMTHAFFKALLFLGSGSVIHAMGGEQDMRRMGALGRHLPTTFRTMAVGALAIAGIPPLAGFFSKDEILYRVFEASTGLWLLAVVTAFLTAFYMCRLVALTFVGDYRGPAWGPRSDAAHTPDGNGPHVVAHAHGDWHGPHESPRAMTLPLVALAVGALLAGFVGVPAALGGNNAIERFLEPSLTVATSGAEPGVAAAQDAHESQSEDAGHESRGVELGLMAFSVAIAVAGAGLAWRLYVVRPESSGQLARRFATAHRVLSHKYYVDELYGATILAVVARSARGLWAFDRRIVDGAVNGSSWLTLFGSWLSGLTDKAVVDGLVNAIGSRLQASSYALRRIQDGLVQNYALLTLFGIFAFASLYLFVR